jgi:hypothetical protein
MSGGFEGATKLITLEGVGNGRDIQFWGGRWLPLPISSVESPRIVLWEGACVAEAKAIFNIPLSPFQPMDRLIWRCTTNGEFFVCSACHLAMKNIALKHSGGSGSCRESVVWKACWQLHVPNVVKIFIWRVCHNLLPTKVNLFRRGVVTNKMSPICEIEEEMVEHIL